VGDQEEFAALNQTLGQANNAWLRNFIKERSPAGRPASSLLSSSSGNGRRPKFASPSYKKMVQEKNSKIRQLEEQVARMAIESTRSSADQDEEDDALKVDIDPSKVQILVKAAEGAFGVVYRGTYLYQDVAIKVLKEATPEVLDDFRQEILLMRRIKSKHTVYFYGVTKNPAPSLLMEWCGRGSLTSVLSNKDETIGWNEVFKFGREMLQGVYALHMYEPPIVHRDIKSLNYLVDTHYNVKLCDFGLARLTMKTQRDASGNQVIRESTSLEEELSSTRGTYEYIAPEIYGGAIYSPKSDVFSLAIIMWEIIYRCIHREYQRPYSEYKQFIIPAALYINVAKKGIRCTIPERTPPPMKAFLERCWSQDPKDRPNTAEMMEELLQLQKVYSENMNEWDQCIIELPSDDKTTAASSSDIGTATPERQMTKARSGTKGKALSRIQGLTSSHLKQSTRLPIDNDADMLDTGPSSDDSSEAFFSSDSDDFYNESDDDTLDDDSDDDPPISPLTNTLRTNSKYSPDMIKEALETARSSAAEKERGKSRRKGKSRRSKKTRRDKKLDMLIKQYTLLLTKHHHTHLAFFERHLKFLAEQLEQPMSALSVPIEHQMKQQTKLLKHYTSLKDVSKLDPSLRRTSFIPKVVVEQSGDEKKKTQRTGRSGSSMDLQTPKRRSKSGKSRSKSRGRKKSSSKS